MLIGDKFLCKAEAPPYQQRLCIDCFRPPLLTSPPSPLNNKPPINTFQHSLVVVYQQQQRASTFTSFFAGAARHAAIKRGWDGGRVSQRTADNLINSMNEPARFACKAHNNKWSKCKIRPPSLISLCSTFIFVAIYCCTYLAIPAAYYCNNVQERSVHGRGQNRQQHVYVCMLLLQALG